MIYIGLDDTDNADSRGTGRLARDIAATLAKRYKVFAVTRHQLLVDPRVPYTSHNSCAALHLAEDGAVDLAALADQVQSLMLADWQDGSDPGLCVARVVEPAMTEFGLRAKRDVVRRAEAHAVAEQCGCVLRGLGGTNDGVIGALAGVGLAVTGNDGRFLLIGQSRELKGVQRQGDSRLRHCGRADDGWPVARRGPGGYGRQVAPGVSRGARDPVRRAPRKRSVAVEACETGLDQDRLNGVKAFRRLPDHANPAGSLYFRSSECVDNPCNPCRCTQRQIRVCARQTGMIKAIGLAYTYHAQSTASLADISLSLRRASACWSRAFGLRKSTLARC